MRYEITSPGNPRIKSAVALRKKRERDRTGLMLIEGIRELSHALEGGIVIESVFFEPDLAATNDGNRLMQELDARNIASTAVPARVFKKLAYRESSGGFVAVARKPKQSLLDLPPSENPLYLVVDAVEKPGNLGAVLRSADAAGLTGLIVSDPKTDLYNPNVIRSSLGTVFTIPTAITTSDDAVTMLKEKKITVFTSTPNGTLLYTGADFSAPSAIVVGSEDRGASDTWLDNADVLVRIPMVGRADSLNVSAAATILIFEALRQRMTSLKT